MKLKKVIALSLISLLVITMTGCGSKGGGSRSDSEIKTTEGKTIAGGISSILDATPKEYKLPLTDKPITLSIAICESWSPEYSLANNLEIWKAIEKDTGVKIKWEVIPNSDYDTVMKSRIASGQIPDIMGIMSTTNPITLYNDGLTIDHGKYIAEYAPNILKQMKENDSLRYLMMGSDGKVYAATADVQYKTANVKGLYYRKDWQKALNIPDPQTLNDYYRMFLAFAKDDPNGNGENDEVAIYPKQMQDFSPFASAFGLDFQVNAGSNSGFTNINGKIEYEYAKPEYKNFLAYIKKFYDAGIIPQEVFGKTETEKTLLASNRLGSYYNGLGQCDTYDKVLLSAKFISKIDENNGYYWLCPPENSQGEHVSSPMVYCQDNCFVVSSKCKYPEIAIKWLDYVWGSEAGARYTCYGIKGKSYTMNKGKPEFTDYILNNPNGLGVQPALRTLGSFAPWITRWSDDAFAAQWVNNAKMTKIINDAKPTFQNKPLSLVLGTPEESSRIASIQADLVTYVDEMTLKFITGQESLDNFDNYLSTLDDMGLKELLDIKNSQYDAYGKISK